MMSKCYVKQLHDAVGYFKDLDSSILHRENGPALVYKDGSCIIYCLDGKLHRLDGPAYYRKWKDGSEEEYWINGIEYKNIENNDQFKRLVKLKALL